jgi:hypothetical protein
LRHPVSCRMVAARGAQKDQGGPDGLKKLRTFSYLRGC